VKFSDKMGISQGTVSTCCNCASIINLPKLTKEVRRKSSIWQEQSLNRSTNFETPSAFEMNRRRGLRQKNWLAVPVLSIVPRMTGVSGIAFFRSSRCCSVQTRHGNGPEVSIGCDVLASECVVRVNRFAYNHPCVGLRGNIQTAMPQGGRLSSAISTSVATN